MRLDRTRSLTLTLVGVGLLVVTTTSCGSDDEADAPDETTAATEAPASEEAPVATEAAAPSATATPSMPAGINYEGAGAVEFAITGGYEVSGTWDFVPAASYFDGSWWSLTFTDMNTPGSIVALSLAPDNMNFSFSDGTATIAGLPDQCTFDLAEQTAAGTSGSFECNGMSAITATSVSDDVSVTGSFDANV
jgi:hypothetical protein